MIRIHRHTASFRAQQGIPLLFFAALVLFVASTAHAQVPTGTPPYGSFAGGPDVINLANLNVHVAVPVLSKPGRGMNFTYDISYDSSVWYPVGTSGSQVWTPVYNWGWRGNTEIATGYLSSYETITDCWYTSGRVQYEGYELTQFSLFVYHDPWGVSHAFSGSTKDYTPIHPGGTCVPKSNTSITNALARDGSGLVLNVPAGTTGAGTITTSSGKVLNPPAESGVGAGTAIDRNGNEITVSNSGVFTDTLGTTALTVAGSGTPASPETFTYTAPSGASASYTMKYTAYTVQTAFGCSGVTEYGPTSTNLVSEIDLPDGTKYTFTYEQTPGVPANVTGRLASVQLPTGGTISYTYTGGSSGIVCADGSTAGLKRYTPDTGSNYWNYSRTAETGAAYITTVTDPTAQANQTLIQFQGLYETQRDIYSGTAPTISTFPIPESTLQTAGLLKETQTCYTSTSPCTGTAVTLPITYRSVITALPVPGSATVQSKSVANYNSVGVPTEVDTYAFGSGAPPTTPTRKTVISYASLGNITAFQQTVTVENGAGNILAQTNYNYDETTPVAAPSGTPQLTSVSGSRGNLTSVRRCTNLTSCSAYLQTTMTYDTAGQLQTVKDPLNNQTSFSYADSFLDDDGSNPPSKTHTSSVPTDAFVTTVTPPLNGAVTSKYYYYSGQLALSTDQNNNSSYNHFQDLFARLTSAYGPPNPSGNRAWTLNVYAPSDTQVDSYSGITDTTASTSCSSCRHDEAVLDGLGRTINGYLLSDPEGQTQVDTVYDSLGRVKTISHPHRTAASATDGIETPTYDALGRTTKVTHPDTTYSQTLYGAAVSGTGVNTAQLCSSSTYGLGFPVVAIDEASKKREFWTDAFGRTIEADEPDSSGNLTSNTCYLYDPLGNLLQIVHGSQTRTYSHDALSRVTSVTIPELANSSGTNCAVTYGYDSNSNLQTRVAPAPNQTYCTTTVTTTYSHDALNRLTKITYGTTTPVATPTVQYGYDGTALTGCATTPPTLTDSNPKGRQTSMCDGSGATSWAHDAAGRIITEKRTILGSSAITETISYSYNLDGSIATMTYPSTKVVTYTLSNAQRFIAAKDVTNNVQFATAASYVPPGGLSGVITGQISGGFGGVTESHNYNSSLEYTSTKATSTAGTAMDLTLNYALSGGDNGTLTGITNNADSGRTQSLTYDPLNRISSAITQATSGTDCWGQNFIPDALANLNTISSAQCSSNTLSVTVDGNNHINSSSTFAYDAAGNMTQDGKGTGYSYSFDAESRLVQATGMTGGPYCYVYDGRGLRVAKKSGANSDCTGGTVAKLYWRSLAGDALAETDGSGNTQNEYVFFAGRRIASRDGSGHIFYWFADQIGSTRTITTGSGTGQTPGQLCYDADFTPYGQEISHSERLQTTACPPSYKFTGYERDPETAYGQGDTGVDYAFARYYSSRLGRFLSTDPLGGSIGDLQSHNAYAYVENGPLSFTDPTGLTKGNPDPPLVVGFYPDCIWNGNCGGWGGAGGGAGYYAGGGSPCSLDGVDVPCGSLSRLLGSNGIAPCPNNDCTGIRAILGSGGTTILQQWVPSQTYPGVITMDPEGVNIPYIIPGYWQTVGTVSDNSGGGLWGAFWTLMDAYWSQVPWSGAISVDPVTVPISYIPKTNTICVGLGLAFSASVPEEPYAVNGGPLLFGNGDSKAVLSGPNVSWSIQPAGFVGYQHIINTKGQKWGPTIGSWGGNLGGSYSGCLDMK